MSLPFLFLGKILAEVMRECETVAG
jgi:hypothetical protein